MSLRLRSAREIEAGNVIEVTPIPRIKSSCSNDLGSWSFLPRVPNCQVEAAIASIHARALRLEDTDWETIVSLYGHVDERYVLPRLSRSFVPSQSRRAKVLSRARGDLPITDRDRVAAYPFYSAALGDLEFRRGRHETAREHFRAALALARNPMERRFLDQRVSACERGATQQAYERFWTGDSFLSKLIWKSAQTAIARVSLVLNAGLVRSPWPFENSLFWLLTDT